MDNWFNRVKKTPSLRDVWYGLDDHGVWRTEIECYSVEVLFDLWEQEISRSTEKGSHLIIKTGTQPSISRLQFSMKGKTRAWVVTPICRECFRWPLLPGPLGSTSWCLPTSPVAPPVSSTGLMSLLAVGTWAWPRKGELDSRAGGMKPQKSLPSRLLEKGHFSRWS